MPTSYKADDFYRPIDCGRYDQLEVLAMSGKKITIEYDHSGRTIMLEDVIIKTTITRDGEEFLKLVSAQEIRLDKLRVVDDLLFE